MGHLSVRFRALRAGSGRKTNPGPVQAVWTTRAGEPRRWWEFLAHDRDARRLEQAGAGKSKDKACAQGAHGPNVASRGKPRKLAHAGRRSRRATEGTQKMSIGMDRPRSTSA